MFKSILSILIVLAVNNAVAGQNYLVDGEVYFTIIDQEVILPMDKVRFAKVIRDYEVSTDADYTYQIRQKEVIGVSVENENNEANEGGIGMEREKASEKEIKNYISLNDQDFVVFKFGRNRIRDINGADLYVFTDESLGALKVSVSKDNKSWIAVGEVNESKRFINLAGEVPIGDKFSFVKVRSVGGEGQITNVSQVAVIKKDDGVLGVRTRIIDQVVHTNSSSVDLLIKDFRVFDFDKISVKLNGKTLTKRKLITKWNKSVTIPLREGENKLIVKSLSEGIIQPTTIDLKIIDGIKINLGTYRMRKEKKKVFSIVRGS